MANILVTGATGNIGGALLQQLAGSEHQVFAGSTSGKNIGNAKGRQVDFLDTAALAQVFAGIDIAFIVAPAHPQMIQMTFNAVDAAKAAGVKHLIRLSGAGSDSSSSFAIAKLQGVCDDYVKQSGLAYTLIQPKNFMQNLINYQGEMIRSGTVYTSHGEGRIPFIDARDIARVIAAIINNPSAHIGQSYVLTGSEALTTSEAMQIVSQAIGKKVEVIQIPEAAAVAAMQQMGMPNEMVEAMSSLNQVIAMGYVAEVTNAVEQLTGKPALNLHTFVKEFAACWQ